MTQTHMRSEVNEIPAAVDRLLQASGNQLAAVAGRLRSLDPAVVVTIARGTSDHAASFIKYAIELQAGVPVASLGPSLASVYQRRLKLGSAAAIAISQSGQSPDIVAMTRSATESGAYSIGLVNTVPSPLADACSATIPLHAGPEIAVAATKSYVNSVIAGLMIVSDWTGDEALSKALLKLPEALHTALSLDWSHLNERLRDARSVYILGRGPSLAIAGEAALKCKETCELHAEAYSSAEVLHGPVSLVTGSFPVLVFAPADAAETGAVEVADRLASQGGEVFITSPLAGKAQTLPRVATGHPLTDALVQIVPYYGMVEKLSRDRNFNPDAPAALQKVTETV